MKRRLDDEQDPPRRGGTTLRRHPGRRMSDEETVDEFTARIRANVAQATENDSQRIAENPDLGLRWAIGDSGNMVTCISCEFEQWIRAQNAMHPWVPGAEITRIRAEHRLAHHV